MRVFCNTCRLLCHAALVGAAVLLALGPGPAAGQELTFSRFSRDGLTPLLRDYETKLGTNQAAFAHQVYCITNTSYREYEQHPNGWASGFVGYMFESMIGEDGLISSQQVDCPAGADPARCFERSAFVHGLNELQPLFARYCVYAQTTTDFERWNKDHEQFLKNALTPCFDHVAASGDLSPFWASYFRSLSIHSARVLRWTVQRAYAVQRFIAGLFKDANEQLPAPLTKAELYSEELAASGDLIVTAKEQFFVKPGTTIQLRVAHRDTGDDLTFHSDTRYSVVLPDDVVTVSSSGLLRVIRAQEPLVNARTPFRVVVQHGESFGVGQFALFDEDADGDLLVDSYERHLGLDPNQPQEWNTDSDGDGLNDVLEVLAGTNVFSADSDGDAFDDAFELGLGSDPMHQKRTPGFDALPPAPADVQKSLDRSHPIQLVRAPTSDAVTLLFHLPSAADVRVEVLSVTGTVVQQHALGRRPPGNHEHLLQPDALEAGMYFVRIKGTAHPLLARQRWMIR